MEKQKPERQTNNRYNRNYNNNQRNQNQSGKKGFDHGTAAQGQTQAVQSQPHNQSQPRRPVQSSKPQAEKIDGNTRENAPNKGYYRDRNRNKPVNSGRFINNRNKAEETIDDIKEDIVRLEKEIELEIKEIKSLKL